MHLQHAVAAIEARNRGDVAYEIEIELIVERDVECVVDADQEKRIAVGRCGHYGFGGDVAAAAGSVLDNELLAEAVGEPLRHEARPGVGGTAGSKTNYDAHRP